MLKTYFNLIKPERTFANVITAAAGFLLASRLSIIWFLFFGTIVGLSLLVASACVLNNYIDRELDTKMARTKKRALASGTVSAKSALTFSIVLGLLGFAILADTTNWLVVLLGAIAYFDYIVLYGWAKRHSVHGTLVGTVCGALPMVAGYCAVTASIDITAVILYLSMTFWQMAHFFAIAIYRLKDYKAGGIPVLPAVKGLRTTKVQIVLYAIAFALTALSLSVFGPTGYVYAAAMAAISFLWLRLAWRGWHTQDDTKWARGMFLFSLKVLLVFAFAVSVGAILP